MHLLLIRPKIVQKNLLIKKGGCFECYAVTGNKTEYYRVYIERLFAPFKGWVNALFSFPGIPEKYRGLEVKSRYVRGLFSLKGVIQLETQ